jgi:hypothetical protein
MCELKLRLTSFLAVCYAQFRRKVKRRALARALRIGIVRPFRKLVVSNRRKSQDNPFGINIQSFKRAREFWQTLWCS